MLAADLLRSRDSHSGPVHKARAYVFGTVAEITIYSEHSRCAQTFAAAVLDDFDRLHWLLHAWKDSALSNLNRAIAAGDRDIPVKPELARLIRDATEFSKRSRGLFNPAIGKLVRQWNFHASQFVPAAPDPRDVRRVLDADPKMTDVMLNGCTVNCANRHVQLDFGGYAKGYALDRAVRFLRLKELTGALVNIGGNLMALGSKGEQQWRVGIQHPRNPGPIARLPLYDGEAISTSGDYERYFMLNGKRHCHLIDPRTGRPASGSQSATVVIPRGKCSGTLSDASSGPLFIQGADGWRELAGQLGITSAMLIDERGDSHLTDEMRGRIELD